MSKPMSGAYEGMKMAQSAINQTITNTESES